MSADLVKKWVAGGATFNYTDPYDIETWQTDRITRRIPTGETPGADGEYQEDSTADARIIAVRGILNASDGSYATLRGYLETLAAAHMIGAAGKLYLNSDRYLNARVAYFECGEIDGLPSNKWEAGFRATPPWFYDDSLTSVTLSAGGGATSVTAGGSINARPAITLVVTHVGTVTLTAAGTGQQMVLNADATGTYVVDSDSLPEPSALLGSADVLAKVSGEFLELIPGTANVSIALSGGAILSAASLSYRKRYAVG